jgi:hypothetical protein
MTTTRIYTTDADIRDDVRQAIEAGEAEGIDIDGIVREIVQTVGVDGYADLDEADFWAIVAKHDSTQD